MQHMRLKSQLVLTGLMDRAQAMSFFEHIKIFNGILI